MKGLKGAEIPLNARIFAIVDVFDALTSKRPYKESFGFEKAMDMLRRDSGSHFDPELLPPSAVSPLPFTRRQAMPMTARWRHC